MIKPNYVRMVYSVDCFTVWFSRQLSARQINELRLLTHPHAFEHKTGKMYGKGNEIWVHKVKISVPNQHVYAYLKYLAETREYLINYMELARDFITETTEQATHLHQWLQPLLVRRWSRNEKTVCRDESGKESIYTDGRQDPQNMDAYVRDSKVTGEPCCHMELRLKGRATVARHGITTFDDLQALDIERMFQSKMALLEVNKDLLPRLGKQFLLKGTPRFSRPSRYQGFRYDRYLRAAYFILRQCRTSQGRVDMQKLKQRMSRKKVKNPQNYFVRLDINALKVA